MTKYISPNGWEPRIITLAVAIQSVMLLTGCGAAAVAGPQITGRDYYVLHSHIDRHLSLSTGPTFSAEV